MNIEEAKEKILTIIRNSNVAKFGGFRPEPDKLHSWFGGHFFGKPDESWPMFKDEPMLPLLQIVTSELPNIPSSLKDTRFLALYVTMEEQIPSFSSNGEGWQILEYSETDDIQKLAMPCDWKIPKRFQIIWADGGEEAPGWTEIVNILNDRGLAKNNGFFDFYRNSYNCSDGTKVAGWPSYIQNNLVGRPLDFVFQVSSNSKTDWSYGGGGNMYFYKDKLGEWSMSWDSY